VIAAARLQAFSDHYYATFDTNRAALASLYQDQSLLTFEGQKFQGSAAIIQKLTSLPFTQCKHHVSSIDVQPSVSGGIIVFITGQIMVIHVCLTLC
jgi:Nuclear transport factor 2 (NTF2) domain